MSMLSAKCERLKDRANELRMLATGLDVPYVIPETKKTMALAMASAASEIYDAADTIWELRNIIVENATFKWHKDNEDLRALIRDMSICIGVGMKCDSCGRFGCCPLSTFDDRMHELGVG